MIYEGILSGFNGSHNEEHYFVLQQLFGNGSNRHEIVYRRFDDNIVVRTPEKPTVAKLSKVDPDIELGSQCIVDIIGNPLDNQGKPITDASCIRKWIELHGKNRYGFDVIELSHEIIAPMKVTPTNGSPFYVHRVKIMALVKVTDVPRFMTAYEHGIGGSRCYGCGMVMLR